MKSLPDKILVGNWKMNFTVQGAITFLTEFSDLIAEHPFSDKAAIDRVWLAPPVQLLHPMIETIQKNPMLRERIFLAAQDCSHNANGAFTGDISAAMVADCGATLVIIGHSERRQNHGESNQIIAQKFAKVIGADLIPIVCVGESLTERDSGIAEQVIEKQLSESLIDLTDLHPLIVAYEPVWAIGTGRIPSLDEISAMHRFIFSTLKKITKNTLVGASGTAPQRLLYGGSVKPDNAAQIMACDHLDGLLVGGASLDAQSFFAIAKAMELP